jgi:hypothetical protein
MTLNYITPNPASEGSAINVYYNFENFSGQTVYWSLTHSSGTSNSNFIGNTSGSDVFNGSGPGWLAIHPKNDYYTQGNWLVNVNFGSSPGNNDYFMTGWITVQDTSHNITCTITETHGAVNEGQTNTFTFTDTSGQLGGKTLYWIIGGASGNNMNPSRYNGNGAGTFVMNNATNPVGTFDVIVSADFRTSSDQQSYYIEVYSADPNDVNSGAIQLIVTGAINVNDTSQDISSFSLTAPPTDGRYLPWTDSTTGVTADINNIGSGNWGHDNNYGGGIVWDGTNHGYITINNYSDNVQNFTISFAANFQPEGGHWNTIYGAYGGAGPFAYAYSDSITAGVGSNDPVVVSSGVTGLAWWDFVYMGTTLTIYKNGTQVATGTLNFATSLGSNFRIGSRPETNSDYLVGTIYQIKYQRTSLLQLAITNQYNSIKSTYGLP